ncbi:MAG: alpha/beta hydrolase, partial [Longimicrobiales bacterium]|nr:alpha/beta hydrolase [Longimicrobiales bacterium]
MSGKKVSKAKSALKWIERIALGFVVLLLALGGLGLAYQTRAQAEERLALSVPGEIVPVDGFGMHLHCTGRGSPTVILEAGAIGFAQTWAWVQESLDRTTRVCSYDRAGLGWSEDWGAHDATAVAYNLRALLRSAGETGPFVLTGHSLGGTFVQVFADLYPDEVVGIGMVDPTHPDQLERFGPEVRRKQEGFHDVVAVASKLAWFGALRAFNVLGVRGEGLPEPDYRAALFFASSPGHLAASHAELAAWEESMDAARRVDDLGDVPLVVISATVGVEGMPEGFLEVSHQMHRELSALSRDGRH